MIIQFTVENFLSLRDAATLSLVASSLKEGEDLTDNIVFSPNGMNVQLLKSAVVYGANASGKSNLVKALDFFKWFVINSVKGMQANEALHVENFRLNSMSEEEPSYFEIVFVDGESQYRYGFEVDEKKVHREWLYQKANKYKAKEVELFFRDGEEYAVHSKFSVGKELTEKKMVRNNALLLSVAAQFNETISTNIVRWFSDATIITGRSEDRIWAEASRQLDNPKMRQRMVDFARYADFGLDDIYKINDVVVSSHRQYDDNDKETKNIVFPFHINESDGTIRYFSLAYPIIDALDNGKRLIIDEIDSKMHPLLTRKVVSLFNSSVTNPKNAQLVCTAHDTNLLKSNLFRRDQVWFTQKDYYGASKLYSLAEYKVRSTAPFEKEYMMGKYGGTPIVGQFERLFDTN